VPVRFLKRLHVGYFRTVLTLLDKFEISLTLTVNNMKLAENVRKHRTNTVATVQIKNSQLAVAEN